METNRTPGPEPAGPEERPVFEEERLLDLIENASDLIQSVAMDGRFLFVNRSWRERLGYTQTELDALRLTDIIHPSHLEACGRMFEALQSGTELPAVETVFVAKDGRSIALEGRVSLRRDRQGHPVATRGIFRDVTEQREAQHRIDELLRMTRAVFDQAPAGMALYDSTGRCVQANEALARTVGATADQLRAQNFRAIPAWERYGLREKTEACLAEWKTQRLETWLTTSFGVEVCLDCRFVPLELDGRRHVLLTTEDVTRDRQRERALRAYQARLMDLHQIAAEVAGQTDLKRVLQIAIDRTRVLVGAEVGVIVRLDPDTGRLAEAFPSNYPMEAIPPGTVLEGRGLLGRIAAEEWIQLDRVAGAAGFGGWPRWHPEVGPMIGAPIRDRDRIRAVMLVGRTPGAAPFDAEDRGLVETVTSLVAVSLRVAEQIAELHVLNGKLSDLATTDALMGIGNRRAFEDAVRLQHATARRYRVPYGLLMADIDRFKQYNDRYGHPAGDRVLATVASRLREALRTMDGIFRYGGEEIVILLPHQRREGTAAAAERLRRCVEAAALEHAGSGAGVVTLSLGGAVFDPTLSASADADWTQVLQAADQALYRAKEQGRNRTEMAANALASAADVPPDAAG